TNLKMSEILATYEYKVGVGGQFPAYSYSAAIGLMSSVITLILVLITNKVTKKLTNTGLW
ncbi:MAG: sugar ABC transporter permease, partial [Clostridia bacterium]|nr:sugar ABC transporter permease [Clostridia bacterium]